MKKKININTLTKENLLSIISDFIMLNMFSYYTHNLGFMCLTQHCFSVVVKAPLRVFS